MKKSFLFLVCLHLCVVAVATVRTVSNNPATLGQFNSIQAAVDASADGDTIYVHGSPVTYAQFNIVDKFITVIGPGWAPDKDMPLQAIVAGCNLRNSTAAGSPAGSELQGLLFSQNVTLTTNLGSDLDFGDLRIIRCQFNSTVTFSLASSEVLFEGNIFLTSLNFNGGATYENFLFQNNIFFANACCTVSSISSISNAINVRFDHNLFFQDNGNIAVFAGNCRFLTLTNNIFNERNAASNLSFSTFNNNITYNSGSPAADEPWTVNSNVDAGGNVANQDPQMVDQASVDAGTFSGLLDFTIAAGPGNNAGADGKDIGLLYDVVGSLNWGNSRNSRLPRVYNMNILNPTISEGGTLNVSVEARKSN